MQLLLEYGTYIDLTSRRCKDVRKQEQHYQKMCMFTDLKKYVLDKSTYLL